MQADRAVLARCLSHASDATLTTILEGLTADRWSQILAGAVDHGVGPLVYRRLQQLPYAARPPERMVEGLRDLHISNALRNRGLFEELGTVLDALRGAGIEALALKGAHLADAVYGDRALRPMADLDLLVPRAALGAARDTLVRQGYGLLPVPEGTVDYGVHQHAQPLEKPGAAQVEFHWNIVPETSPFRVDVEGLWTRAGELAVSGGALRVLSPGDLLLHLCTHVAWTHRFAVPLLWLHDISATLERFEADLDWDHIGALVRADGRGRFISCALSLVAEVLELPSLPDGAGAIGGDADERSIVALARDHLLEGPRDFPVMLRTSGAEALEGGEGVLPGLFPAPTRLREMYGLPAGSWRAYPYYLYRPIDLLRRRGRDLLHFVFRTEKARGLEAWEERRSAIAAWIDKPAP